MKIEKFNLNKTLAENRWLWHFGFWLFYFFIRLRPYYVTVLFYDKLFLKYMLFTEILFLVTTYLTLFIYNLFIPKKQFISFFLSGVFLWNLFVVAQILLKKQIMHKMPNIANANLFEMFLDQISYYLFFYLFIILLKYFKQNFIYQYIQNQQKQQQMYFDLENLKAQISPHFLFNTMNNFYGLAVDNSKKLPNLMIRLSDLLRYSLYETKNEKVSLSSEIKYLENYIELEKIRLEENLNLEFIVDKNNLEKYQIAPLLLITFLENAFKHSKNIHNEYIVIAVHIKISDKGILNFKISNNFSSESKNTLLSERGIGLENVKKRLKVMYPNNNHLLIINNDKSFYNVELILNLV